MEILNLIQKLKDEADKLESTRKTELLDMIDSFETAVKELLDPTADELYDEMYGKAHKETIEEMMDDDSDKEADRRHDDNLR